MPTLPLILSSHVQECFGLIDAHDHVGTARLKKRKLKFSGLRSKVSKL